MSGFFNSFYYGKAGKADFTPDQLPANRVQLFFEMLRVRFSGIVGMNLMYVLFSIPALAWTWINLMVLNGTVEYDEAGNIISQVALSAAEANSYILIYLLAMIPCFMIAAVGSVGITQVLRNWARDQHSFVMSDFKDSVKSNWKGALLIGFINGVSLVLTFVCYRYYGAMAAQGSVFWLVPQMLVIILCCIWWMGNMVIMPMMITYDMSFKTLVRNSFVIVVARLPWSVLIWGLSLAIPYLLLTYVPYGTIITVALYLICGFGITFFIYVSYANSCFDRFLNPRIEGAQVNQGLRDPSYKEEDDEPISPEDELK